MTRSGPRHYGTIGWVSVLLLSGCYSDFGPTPDEERGKKAAPLFGPLSTNDCTSAQAALLASGHRLGKLIAPAGEFGACIERRMIYEYKQCLSPSDPFLNQSRPTQLQKALTIMRASNTASVEINCKSLAGGINGQAGVDGYGDSHEEIDANRSFLDGHLAQGVGDFERADVAGLIWHEAMHQQGYQHSGDNDFCGYPSGQYSRGANSVPYFADRCMRSAGIHSRLYTKNGAGFAQSFGLGHHRASQGDFNIVGDNQIASMRLGPASRATWCTDETPLGGTGCTSAENFTAEYGALLTAPAGISYLEVEPRLLVYSDVRYGGTVQALGFGEFRALLGDLATVGNDAIRSIYVPAGMRVRACEHEGGTAGHGTGRCMIYDGPVGDLGTMSNTISYLEVEPVVTAFREANGFGVRQNFGRGAFSALQGNLGAVGDNHIVSLIVPHGLFAQICSDAAAGGQGAGTCRLLFKSNLNLYPSGPSDASFLLVGPHYGDTLALTVARSGPGTVVSTPYGIQCGSTCTAQFYRRSPVKLVATPATSSYETVWSGCDSIFGNTCSVTMMTARTVSVLFRLKPTPPPDCYSQCLSLCIAGGGLYSQCVPGCNSQCANEGRWGEVAFSDELTLEGTDPPPPPPNDPRGAIGAIGEYTLESSEPPPPRNPRLDAAAAYEVRR